MRCPPDALEVGDTNPPCTHLSPASWGGFRSAGLRSQGGGTECKQNLLSNQRNRIFGNSKLLLRKSEFLGMFLISITKLKVKFIFMYSSPPCCLNVLFVCICDCCHPCVNQNPSPQVFPGTSYGHIRKLWVWWVVIGWCTKGPTWRLARAWPGGLAKPGHCIHKAGRGSGGL